MENPIQFFFTPRGVALIGASSSPTKLSFGVLENMTKFGFLGKVYPVNPKGGEILGLKCYSDISQVPDPVDLAVIMIPAPLVPATLIACGQRGIKAVTVVSGGFKEVGKDGSLLEEQCVSIARSFGMRMIGPNCVGTMDLHSGLNTTFIRGMLDAGPIGFISQSGAVCGAVVDYLMGKGIGFSHFVSMGNEADINETDLIEFFKDHPKVKVIAAYVEAIQDGPKFMKIAREVGKIKPIVILKAGRSQAGERAVSSHTGSLAGSYSAYRSAFRQVGVLETSSIEELFDVSLALANQPLPQGKRTVIITNAGGPAALASDSLSENGFILVDLNADTKSYLRERLNPAAQVNNPIDMLGGASAGEYQMALEASIKDEAVDIVLPINVPTSLVDPAHIANAVANAADHAKKTVLSCLMGNASIQEARSILHSRKVPMYSFPEQLGLVLGSMIRYRDWLVKEAEPIVVLEDIQRKDASQHFKQHANERYWGEAVVRPLLKAYGIPVIKGITAATPFEAISAAEEIGFPVALKVVSKDILHKSDAGGIKLNLNTQEAVLNAYEGILESCHIYHPGSQIEGVLVERMALKGVETIVGMRRDPQFGPLLMFGLGGIYVELFTDIAFRVAPLSWQMAREMVDETKAGRLLAGMRGQNPADIEAVLETILRLSMLALNFPEIAEIEINPLLVLERGEGVLALDARAILDPNS